MKLIPHRPWCGLRPLITNHAANIETHRAAKTEPLRRENNPFVLLANANKAIQRNQGSFT